MLEGRITEQLARNFGTPYRERGNEGVDLDVNNDGRLDVFELIARGSFSKHPDISLDMNNDEEVNRKDVDILRKYTLSADIVKKLDGIVTAIERNPALFTGIKKDVSETDQNQFMQALTGSDNPMTLPNAFREQIMRAVAREPEVLADLRKLLDDVKQPLGENKRPELPPAPSKGGKKR